MPVGTRDEPITLLISQPVILTMSDERESWLWDMILNIHAVLWKIQWLSFIVYHFVDDEPCNYIIPGISNHLMKVWPAAHCHSHPLVKLGYFDKWKTSSYCEFWPSARYPVQPCLALTNRGKGHTCRSGKYWRGIWVANGCSRASWFMMSSSTVFWIEFL